MPRGDAILDAWAADFLSHEADALLGRLDRVLPFALSEVMVPAANLSSPAQIAIERYLAHGRDELRGRIGQYRRWLHSVQGRRAATAESQRRFTVIRLRFNAVLTQFDLFADALSQRSERNTGIWLSGLDALAADALSLPGWYEPPPVICYLDRGVGAAIRRARTRLPGGGANPVAIIRVPRERMVGSGIASSLVHEVGHQSAALLGLVDSLRAMLRGRAERAAGDEKPIWGSFERWISEIVADLWSVARLGITSTVGLIGVVSLPRAFVFRVNLDDPHPFPWIRVKLSCALGRAIYPHPQWDRLAALWEDFYPPLGLRPDTEHLLRGLEARLPELVELLTTHQPPSLGGEALIDVLDADRRQPRQLRACYERWQRDPVSRLRTAPTLVFAALGQQRSDGLIGADEESETLAKMLTHWAVTSTLEQRGGTEAYAVPGVLPTFFNA